MNDTPNTNTNTETPNVTTTPTPESYTKPDFKSDAAFANLSAVTETSYPKIDILADIRAICEKCEIPQNFG